MQKLKNILIRTMKLTEIKLTININIRKREFEYFFINYNNYMTKLKIA